MTKQARILEGECADCGRTVTGTFTELQPAFPPQRDGRTVCCQCQALNAALYGPPEPMPVATPTPKQPSETWRIRSTGGRYQLVSPEGDVTVDTTNKDEVPMLLALCRKLNKFLAS